MDSFIQLIVSMLNKGVSVELKFTPSLSLASKPLTQPSQANQANPKPTEDFMPQTIQLNEQQLKDKEFKELADLLYPDSVESI